MQTRVLAFLDPCQIYFATKDFICHKLEIANDERNLDIDLGRASASTTNDDVVVGHEGAGLLHRRPERLAVPRRGEAGRGTVPVMVHLGRFPFTPTIPTSVPARRRCAAVT